MRPIPGLIHDNSRPCLFTRRSFISGLAIAALTSRLSAQARPTRIVSTAPSSTEALFALGLGDQVVGVSRFCVYPDSVRKLPKVGTYLSPDPEAIARLLPDLVVLQKLSSELTDRLRALHINYIEVPHGTLEEVYTGITLMAKAAGVPERAIALNDRMNHTLAALQAKAKQLSSPRVLMIVDRRPGLLSDMTAVGPNNYVQQLIEIAGGINVLAIPGLPMYPRISLETVLRNDPEVIIDISGQQQTEAERIAVSPQVLSLWGQQSQLNAVRKGRVFAGTSNALLVPGPRAPEAAKILFDYMHSAASKGRTS